MSTKIVYILNNAELANGANMSFLAMLDQLMQQGIVPMVLLPERGPLCNLLEDRSIRYEVFTYRPATYPNGNETFGDKLLFLPRTIARCMVNARTVNKAIEAVRDFAPDIIHTNVSIIDIGSRMAQKLNVPHVFHVREYGEKDFGYRHFPCRKAFTKRIKDSYSICITRDIQQYHGLSGTGCSFVVYNGIRSRMETMPAGGKEDFFLYAGKIHHSKGLDLLLEAYVAYATNTSAPLPLYVAGDATGKGYIQQQKAFIAHHHLEEKVLFIGARTDISHLMEEARATIIPSRHEAFGRVMPEAMFCGCPVIVHATDGSREQLDNGRQQSGNDIAFSYLSTDELQTLLCKFTHTTRNDLHDMCLRAFSIVNSIYTAEANAAGVLKVYQKILTHRHSKQS